MEAAIDFMALELSKLKTLETLPARILSYVGQDALKQLTDEGFVPCYKLIDPKTQEVKETYYVPAEVEDYIIKNHFQIQKGVPFTPEYNFIFIDKDTHLPKRPLEIPRELSAIEGLYEIPIDCFVRVPGIYFLCKEDRVVYVGQSLDVSSRVVQHIADWCKDFDRAYWIPIPPRDLNTVEAALIKHLQPELNYQNRLGALAMHERGIVKELFKEPVEV